MMEIQRLMQLLDNEARIQITNFVLSSICQTMKKPVFFMMPMSPKCEESVRYIERIRCAYQEFLTRKPELSLVEVDIFVDDLAITNNSELSDMAFKCMAIDTGSKEKLKDFIKKYTFPEQEVDEGILPINVLKSEYTERIDSLIDILNGKKYNSETTSKHVGIPSIEDFGIFYPTSIKLKNVINHSFDHGGGHFYRFRLCHTKIQEISEIPKTLIDYLYKIPLDCPNHYFKHGPRISALKWPVYPITRVDQNSLLPSLAGESLVNPLYKSAHDNVEVHCLSHDSGSVVVEVPVWLHKSEVGSIADLFDSAGIITGHIDLIRFRDGYIEIWDYKPDLNKTDQVGLQVLLYAIAMSIRLKHPISKFKCGYFDASEARIFKPVLFSSPIT